jgi:hypothetical protein
MSYEYPNLMLLDLGPKQVLVIVSIRVSLRMPAGYLLPDDMKISLHQNDKANKQWTPRHLFYLPMVTTRKTLIHVPIIYNAPCLGAPRISICGAPRNMCHRFCLMCGAPNMRCATHMWAPMGTIAGGCQAPTSVAHNIAVRHAYDMYLWRTTLPCATEFSGPILWKRWQVYLWCTVLRCTTDIEVCGTPI